MPLEQVRPEEIHNMKSLTLKDFTTIPKIPSQEVLMKEQRQTLVLRGQMIDKMKKNVQNIS